MQCSQWLPALCAGAMLRTQVVTMDSHSCSATASPSTCSCVLFSMAFSTLAYLWSMEGLQWYLCRDGRLATLPPGLQDLLLHLAFWPRPIRKQVRAFLWTLQHGGVSWDAVRKWQAWLRLQCWYDPPIYCRHAYAAIYVLQM